jgi:hypothetical protein
MFLSPARGRGERKRQSRRPQEEEAMIKKLLMTIALLAVTGCSTAPLPPCKIKLLIYNYKDDRATNQKEADLLA